MRISDWSSDVCSSDLRLDRGRAAWVQVTLQLRSSGPLLADLLRSFDVVLEHRLQAVVRLVELLLRTSGAERATDVRPRLLPTSEDGLDRVQHGVAVKVHRPLDCVAMLLDVVLHRRTNLDHTPP